ncbi:cysteine/glutathione ABC transporter permease/ATP-binding protein CydD [Orbaceae bacterium ESL0721]|nr:cysteine/glutathione ABC transporter permease/ATP-binding protein CydD [Orbaceae bacterium ESL0721]
MSLDKKVQTHLLHWLKQQTKMQKSALRYAVLIGFFSAIVIIMQAALLATILQKLIIEKQGFGSVTHYLLLFIGTLLLRALFTYLRAKINFTIGVKIRQQIRQLLLNRIETLGPAYLQNSGSSSTLIVEQVDKLQDFYANYLPQMRLAMIIPILIVVAILPFNWAAAIILLATAPLIPIFMILVGMGAADVNRRNFKALAHLSGHFLDRLKGLKTIRLFNQGAAQTVAITAAAEDFRQKTVQVLKLAFLSSAVLEFFTSIAIAVVAVYFGFSYLGEFHFGASFLESDHNLNGGIISLFSGFFALILAPEFFQPLRDLGTFYHAKAEAVAAADNIENFLTATQNATKNSSGSTESKAGTEKLDHPLDSIVADHLSVLSTDQKPLVGPLSFNLQAPFNLAIIGTSGEGKSSIFNALLGFLPYQGSLKINGIELRDLDLTAWQQQLSWIGQNPYLLNATVRQNILLAKPDATQSELDAVIDRAQLTEVIAKLPDGLDTNVGENAVRLSIGQAQRIAIARAMLKPCQLLLLDEPTASLDKATIAEIPLHDIAVNSITITHQIEDNLEQFSAIWQLKNSQILPLTTLQNGVKTDNLDNLNNLGNLDNLHNLDNKGSTC